MGTDKHVLLVRIETSPGKRLGNEPTKSGTRKESTLILTFDIPSPSGWGQSPVVANFSANHRIWLASLASFPFTFSSDFEERAAVEPDAVTETSRVTSWDLRPHPSLGLQGTVPKYQPLILLGSLTL